MFNICENMVLQNLLIIYTHLVEHMLHACGRYEITLPTFSYGLKIQFEHKDFLFYQRLTLRPG
jgi:hypothetical protein